MRKQQLSAPTPQVHVWHAHLQPNLTDLETGEGLLSDEEQAQAAEMDNPANRYCYIQTRAMLRTLLARYLRCDPSQICLARQEKGKPVLAKPAGMRLHFNLSHTGTRIAIAISSDYEVGVDIEALPRNRMTDQVVERFCSQEENTIWRSVSESNKPLSFCKLWTLKEAYVKALGEGLAMRLDGFAIDWRPQTPLLLRTCKKGNKQCCLHSFPVSSNCWGGLAVEGATEAISVSHFHSSLQPQCSRTGDLVFSTINCINQMLS